MPKLKPETQALRREHILDAAERCFARAGFHRTTMQDICKEAQVSPGAIYIYCDSKEALIEALCERDRTEFSERFSSLADAPDVIEGIAGIGARYFVEESAHKRLFVVEMGVESTRNPRIAKIYHEVDGFCRDSFRQLFQRLKDDGRIAPVLDIPALVEVFHVMGEGMFWRRAVHPDFDGRAVIQHMMVVLHDLLRPVGPADMNARILINTNSLEAQALPPAGRPETSS